MMKFFKKLTINITLVIIGLIFAILILELLLRLMGAKPQTYLRKFSQHHPVLGWVKTPNMAGEFIKGTRKIHEKINSHGLRDIEYDYEKPDSTFRILVIGDSFTEGYDVEFEYLFTEILESTLNDSLKSRGYRYEVINAGTGGYSNDQEYLYYSYEGYKYSPDIVIMMMYTANDIYYNTKDHYGNYFKPLFIAQNDSLYLSNVPLPQPKHQESVKDIFRNMALYPFVTKIIFTKFPGLTNWLGEKGFISKSTLEQVTNRKDVSTDKPVYPSSFNVFNRQYDEEMNHAWLITELMIRDLNKICNDRKQRFILFSIPDKFQVYESIWTETKKAYRVNDSIWNPSKPDSLLKTFSDQYQFPFLSFKGFITENYIHEYMYGGVHWNNLGNQRAAEFIFLELKNLNYLPY